MSIDVALTSVLLVVIFIWAVTGNLNKHNDNDNTEEITVEDLIRKTLSKDTREDK